MLQHKRQRGAGILSISTITMNQDESVDLFAYAQICESIRQTMSKVVDLKNGKVDEPNADITELRMEVLSS